MALEHRKIAKKFAVRRINRLIAEVWPSTERWKPTARVPAWVGDLDLWAKCVKEVGGHGRGYGSSLTEASMKYRQQGGSIRRSPTRFAEIKASAKKATTLSDIPDNLYGDLNDILWERASGDGKIPDGEIGTTVDRLLRQEEINGTDRTDVEWVQWARYVDLGRKNFRE